MKFLFFSDLHSHIWKPIGQGDELYKRLLEQENVIDQIIDIRDRYNAITVFGGDLFHKVGDVPVESINMVKKLTIDILVCGNHDIRNRVSPNWFNIAGNIFDARCDSIDNIFDIGGIKIKVVNYFDKVDYAKVKGYDIVVLHKTPIGSKVGDFVFEDGVDWKQLSKNNRFVFFGHIHQRQKLNDNTYVLGSPMHFNFGDIGDRGVYLLDTDDWSLEFIKLKYPEFINVKNIEEVKDVYNYYRVPDCDDIKNHKNVVAVTKPIVIEERIKSTSFMDILKEWLTYNNRLAHDIKFIEKHLSNREQRVRDVYRGKLLKVKIKDFMSIENVEYDLSNGFILISAENGSGKTNIIGESIYWCLTGETTKGITGNDVIRDVPTKCKDSVVELKFEDYIVIRSRKEGLKIIKDNKDIVEGLLQKERQHILENNVLGIDCRLYNVSCYFSQEKLMTLLTLGDTGRINMITDILGFDEYDSLYSMVCDDIIEIDNSIENDRKNIKDIEVSIDKLECRKEYIIKDISLHNDIQRNENMECKKIEDTLIILEKGLNKEGSTTNILADNSNTENINRLRDGILELDNKKDTVKKLLIEKDINNKIYKLNEYKGKIVNSIYNIDKNIKDKKSIINKDMGDVRICYACGSNIDIDKFNKYIESIQNNIFNLEEEKGIYSKKLDDIKTNICKVVSYYNKCNKRIKGFELEIESIKSKEKELLDKQIEDKNKDIRINNIKNDIILNKNKLKQKKEYLIIICGGIDDKKKEIDIIINDINKYKKNILENENIISDKLKDKDILEFWKYSFSAKGIKSVLLDRFCNEYNNILSYYISIISNGNMRVELKSKKVLKSKEERNGLSFVIYKKGKKRDYKALSGGEKKRVELSICLALNKYITSKYKLKRSLFGFMIFDELFSFIDREGEECIANIIKEYSRDNTIFCISHTADLSSFADKIWNVIMTDSISSLSIGE
jgi:DNA repair exonuclease SbcCD ATPase subunit